VTLSFGQPYKTVTGTFDVPEQDKLVRTIAIDRTRKVAFSISAGDTNEPNDVNEESDANQPADVGELPSPMPFPRR
jgi:hypothetical protein